MLSNKTEILAPVKKYTVHILGNTAQSFFFAAAIQKSGHDVTLLCRPQEADEYNATDFIFKDARRLQNRRCQISCSFEQASAPDVLLITSDSPRLRSDLLLISPSMLKQSLIINFCPTAPSGFISELLGLPVINAYYSGWLTPNKNHIHLLSGSQKIIFSLPQLSVQMSFLTDLFAASGFELSADEADNVNYWSWLAPKIISTITGALFGKNLRQEIKKAETRKLIDSCLDEIMLLAAGDNAFPERGEILTALHNIPEGFISPLITDKPAIRTVRLQRISALLFRNISAEDRRFPALKDIINRLSNNF